MLPAHPPGVKSRIHAVLSVLHGGLAWTWVVVVVFDLASQVLTTKVTEQLEFQAGLQSGMLLMMGGNAFMALGRLLFDQDVLAHNDHIHFAALWSVMPSMIRVVRQFVQVILQDTSAEHMTASVSCCVGSALMVATSVAISFKFGTLQLQRVCTNILSMAGITIITFALVVENIVNIIRTEHMNWHRSP